MNYFSDFFLHTPLQKHTNVYNSPRWHWVQHPSLSEANLPLENSPIAQMGIF